MFMTMTTKVAYAWGNVDGNSMQQHPGMEQEEINIQKFNNIYR
jgi:hypothetical protein